MKFPSKRMYFCAFWPESRATTSFGFVRRSIPEKYSYAFWPCVQNKTISRGYVKKQKLKKKSRKVKLLKPEPYDLKCPIQKGVAGVIQESVLRVTHVRENEKHRYKRFLPDVCLPMLGDDSRIQLTTPENTITYHNALCLSPPSFA